MPLILSVCLSPALQRTLVFHEIRPGCVNRAEKVRLSTGGKGVNVARIINQLGTPSTFLGIFGAKTGRKVRILPEAGGVSVAAVENLLPAFICRTRTDLHRSPPTELVVECPPVSSDLVQRTWFRFRNLLEDHKIVVLSGPVPQDFNDPVYTDFIHRVRYSKNNPGCSY